MSEKTSPIESVDRALRLLVFLRDSGPKSVSEAAEMLNVAPSTAHRLLGALTFRGFAVQSHDRRYCVGSMMSNAGAETFPAQMIRQLAQEALQWLQQQVGETVQLMVMRGGNIQFIDGVECTQTLRVGMRMGDQMPAFVSAGGKAILARYTNTELEELYRGGLPKWPMGRISSMQELKRSMTKIRRSEFATSFEETEQGVVGLGVSIDDAEGRPVAALTTATPSIRFDRSEMPEHVAALHQAASMITHQLSIGTR